MQELAREIDNIGEQLVMCSQPCEGIARDQASGILPRCLFLQFTDLIPHNGCAIIGINPGRTDERDEKPYYKAHGATYSSVRHYFAEEIIKKPYYVRLSKLADAMGHGDAILWTELAKCENSREYQGLLLPLETFRSCSGRYLSRELEHVPTHWPLVGVGNEAYKALAYLHPLRPVLGVPHPTGARGNLWRGLFEGDSLKPEILGEAQRAISSKTAIWLGRRNNEAQGPAQPLPAPGPGASAGPVRHTFGGANT